MEQKEIKEVLLSGQNEKKKKKKKRRWGRKMDSWSESLIEVGDCMETRLTSRFRNISS